MNKIYEQIKNKKNKKGTNKSDIKIIRIAGVTFNNDDGTSRQKILAKCLANGKTKAKFIKYNFDGEKAIRVITEYGQIGNIPREEIQNILSKVELMEDIEMDIKTFRDDNSKKTFFCDIAIKYAKSKKELKMKKIQDKSKVFTCAIVKECDDKSCNNLIDCSIKFKDLNKDDLYNEYSKKEIKETYSKVYECNDYVFPCDILNNEESGHYDVFYREHDKEIYLGYIPPKYNKEIDDIINNKKVINGGILLLGGKYIEYDYTEKMNKGIDEYVITLRIRYE